MDRWPEKELGRYGRSVKAFRQEVASCSDVRRDSQARSSVCVLRSAKDRRSSPWHAATFHGNTDKKAPAEVLLRSAVHSRLFSRVVSYLSVERRVGLSRSVSQDSQTRKRTSSSSAAGDLTNVLLKEKLIGSTDFCF